VIGGVVVSKKFKFSEEYFKEVADVTSDYLKWEAVWVCLSREISNDVTFLNSKNNSLTVDLSGTRRHLTMMDGKIDEAKTNINDICQIPMGLSARFAWETLGAEQNSVMLEFGDNIFATHCPEIVSGLFLKGHLKPQNYSPKHELTSLVRILARELDSNNRRGRLFADSVIRLLAIEIAESAWTCKPNRVNPEVAMDPRIRKVIDFIEANFSGNISLHELCIETRLNATHLISLFKRATGRTPYAYVIHRRIREATHLLRKNHMPISEVALEAGFSDQQQMTHAFNKHLGRTPKSFRTAGDI
jgi:AraC family transcriptional regulator